MRLQTVSIWLANVENESSPPASAHSLTVPRGWLHLVRDQLSVIKGANLRGAARPAMAITSPVGWLRLSRPRNTWRSAESLQFRHPLKILQHQVPSAGAAVAAFRGGRE